MPEMRQKHLLRFSRKQLRALYEKRLHDKGSKQMSFVLKVCSSFWSKPLNQIMKMKQLHCLKLQNSWEDIFNSENGFMFKRKFPPECQKQSVPVTFNVPNFYAFKWFRHKRLWFKWVPKLPYYFSTNFNCKKEKVIVLYNSTFITVIRTTTALIYIRMSIHTQTRSGSLSSRHQCKLWSHFASWKSTCCGCLWAHNEVGIICPIQLHHTLFTVGALTT